MVLNLSLLFPEIFILTVAILSVIFDLLIPNRLKNKFFSVLSVSTLTVSIFLLVVFAPLSPQTAFFGFVKKDLLSVLSGVLIVFSALMTVFISYGYIGRFRTNYIGEFYYTLLFSTFGALLMVSSNELSTLFVSLEVMSISIYILISLFKGDYRGKEAALKYFIMGSVGAAVIVYGFSILYGLSGSTVYDEVGKFLSKSGINLPVLLSLSLVVSGFLFKLGAVPFHGWTPDSYHGAPTPVTLFMGAVVKVASFVALIRLFYPVFLPLLESWGTLLSIVGVVSAFVGALMALNQENVKRMLAYSAISHTGVVLTAFSSLPSLSIFSVLFYVFAYAFMTIAAFGLVSLLSTSGFKGERLSEWRNLYSRSPLIALSLVVAFMSLAGIPPLFGFWAKFYILVALIRAGKVAVAVAVLISSVISLYFYLRPLVYAFMKEGESVEFSPNPIEYGAVVVIVLFLIVFGLFPEVVSQASLLALSSFIRGMI
jgi:NADH-quinone oxidoreductase subunit N